MVLELSKVVHVRKRDGRIVGFDQEKVTEAIWKAAQSVGGEGGGHMGKRNSADGLLPIGMAVEKLDAAKARVRHHADADLLVAAAAKGAEGR